MTLKTKKTCVLVTGLTGLGFLLFGFSFAIAKCAECTDNKEEITKYVESIGYEETKAELKQQEITKLVEELNSKPITQNAIDDFIESYGKIKEISQEEYMQQYATAQQQEKYEALLKADRNDEKIGMAVSIPFAAVGFAGAMAHVIILEKDR